MKFFLPLLAGVVASSVTNSANIDNQCMSQQKSKAHASPFSQNQYRSFKLINVYDETYNTKVFRFALPAADMPLNLTVASCITLRFIDKDGTQVVRPYTPLNREQQIGYFDIMVKRYNNSKMGSHLFSMRLNDSVQVKGPWIKIPIKSNQYKQIGMLAAGTGITPMYQIARNVLSAPKNITQISLIYANTRKQDVLLGNEINDLMQQHTRFSPYFVLSKAPSDWMGGVGYVNKQMITSLLPPPSNSSDSIILVCGPPPFMNTISGDKSFTTTPPSQGELKGLLKDIGYSPRMVYKF